MPGWQIALIAIGLPCSPTVAVLLDQDGANRDRNRRGSLGQLHEGRDRRVRQVLEHDRPHFVPSVSIIGPVQRQPPRHPRTALVAGLIIRATQALFDAVRHPGSRSPPLTARSRQFQADNRMSLGGLGDGMSPRHPRRRSCSVPEGGSMAAGLHDPRRRYLPNEADIEAVLNRSAPPSSRRWPPVGRRARPPLFRIGGI